MGDLIELRNGCLICLSKVMSGLGSYPWTCGNGHTLYRGSGAFVDTTTGRIGIPPSWYEPPAAEPTGEE